MGRPSVVTPAVAEAIERHRAAGGLDAVLARLAEDGHTVSRSSLARHLRAHRRPANPVRPSEPTPGAVADADAPDRLRNLARAQAYLAAALDAHGPKLGRDRKAVLSFASIIKAAAEVARAIDEATPRPPEQRYAAVEGAALVALLTRAREAADPAGRLAAAEARIAALMGVLEKRLGGAAA
jgi:hypothetical protein